MHIVLMSFTACTNTMPNLRSVHYYSRSVFQILSSPVSGQKIFRDINPRSKFEGNVVEVKFENVAQSGRCIKITHAWSLIPVELKRRKRLFAMVERLAGESCLKNTDSGHDCLLRHVVQEIPGGIPVNSRPAGPTERERAPLVTSNDEQSAKASAVTFVPKSNQTPIDLNYPSSGLLFSRGHFLFARLEPQHDRRSRRSVFPRSRSMLVSAPNLNPLRPSRFSMYFTVITLADN